VSNERTEDQTHTHPDQPEPTHQSGQVQAAEVILLSGAELPITIIDGQILILFSRAMEHLGLNAESQARRLRRLPWATFRYETVQPSTDEQPRRTLVCDETTFLGHCFTVRVGSVRQELQPALLSFQRETVAALTAYWTRGLAVNPRGRTPAQEVLIEAAAVGLAGPVLDELHRAHCAGQVLAGRRDGDRATARRALGVHVERAYSAALDAGLVARQELAVADAAPIA